MVPLAVGPEFQRVDDPERRLLVRQRYGLPGSFVLFVGSIEPRKNLTALISAMAELRKRGVARPLVLAGSGPLRYLQRLRAFVRESELVIGSDVMFIGYVDEADLPTLYSLCDVFAFPSICEGFGLPPLEAMACGAPVVISDNSSLKELYADSALSVAPTELGDALGRLLEDPSLRLKLVEQGRVRARTRSWDEVAAETHAVYRRVLAER